MLHKCSCTYENCPLCIISSYQSARPSPASSYERPLSGVGDVSPCASTVECHDLLNMMDCSIDNRLHNGRIVENQSYSMVPEMNYIILERDSDSSLSDILPPNVESIHHDGVESTLESRDLLNFAKQIASGMVC